MHHVFDRLRQVVRVGVEPLDDPDLAIVEPGAHLAAQDVEIAEDHLHRSAKLVRKIGQSLHVHSLLPVNRLPCGPDRIACRRLGGRSRQVAMV